MFRSAGCVRRAMLLAAFVMMAWALSMPGARHAARLGGTFVDRPSFEARALFSSLPHGLLPPAELGSRVMAMVAGDIDADGDLDVIATDEALGLIVWTNDGTGHLTRAHGHGGSNVRPEPAGPGVTERPASQEPTVQVPSPGLSADSSTSCTLALRRAASLARSSAAPRRALVSVRSPRAPPHSRLLA